VSFALLVDALHGVDIDFPHPAFDRNTGLDVTTAGTVHLNGPQALAFVRSRHYVEVIDGRNVPDATGDLGRVHRQQEFLSAVLSKLGHSKNPFTLARAATNASSGLRVDDSLGFLDAARLAMKLRGLHPLSVVLPTKLGANGDGSVLFLVHPDADPVLASFKDGTPGPVVTTTTTAPAAG
jgi:anionic cell wall polymer biosynthesis LytR-Cps2A-Psr (LCP) family protein